MKNVKSYISRYNVRAGSFPTLDKLVITQKVNSSRTLSYFKEFYHHFSVSTNKPVIYMLGTYLSQEYMFKFIKL